MEKKFSKIGEINSEFDLFKLKEVLIKNDAGDWGDDPKEGAIGVIRSTNFTNKGLLDLSDVAYRSLKPNKLKEKRLCGGEILIERSGGSDTQPVGRVGYITEEIASNEFAFANFIQRIAIDDTIDHKFLYYCLQQMYEMGITASMQYQTTGIRNLDWKLYTKSFLPKPPNPEQRTISSIISKVDEAITATQNSIAKAERLRKSLMQNLLTGKLKPDGTWRKDNEFYEDEKFGNVPIGWAVKPVGDKAICQINPNYKFTKGKAYPFLPMEAINDKFNGINYFEERKIDTTSGYARFKTNDILFAKITPCTENGKVAFVDELKSDVGFASTEFIVLSPSENIYPKFLYYRVINGDVHRLTVSLMEGTTGRQRVPAKIFRNRIFIAIPTDANEQRIIAEKIGSIDSHFAIKQTKIKKLERLKKALMQNLLIGKVRLPAEVIAEAGVKVHKDQLQTETM